ncbi:MAG TPA: glucan ABC transporter ATP-binding protein/ permease [Acetobacteraceae bacterium]|nr:glucan ABC transporter ATP-binding protein/ permease [Acetobacteraceae bacterium]
MRFLKVYWRALALLGPDRKIAALLALGNLIVAGLQFLDPVLFGRVIGLLADSALLRPDVLWQQATVLLSIWAGVGVAGIASNMATALQAERLAHRNRIQAIGRYYAHVLGLPLSFHGDVHSGRLMKVMISGTDGLFAVWLVFFREQLATLGAVIVLLPLTFLMNWRLAACLAALVLIFVSVTSFVVLRTQAGQRRAEGANTQLAGALQDALGNIVVVQSFTRLAAERRLFANFAQQVIAHQFPVLNWWAVVNVLTRGASTLAVISIVVLGTILHLKGEAEVADVVSFMGFATLLIGRLEAAVNFAANLFFRAPAIEDYFAVLDAPSTVPDGGKELVASAGEVEFDHVSFAYPGGQKVLNDVSFTAHKGMVVALVGHTGAGKSTVMSLLQRLWDPTEGRITIDGQDIRQVTLESLRRAIGVVFQESMLFNRSIRDNLLVGKPDATQEEIEYACKLADAHEFIMRQTRGYDTLIGERGSTLSGGQRQRLAIARALLKNPPILILDEATSALDAATEARVSRALRNLMRGRTTFVIAHRLSTVRDADQILVFDSGRIIEQGTFEELLARGATFADLVRTQLTGAPPLQAATAA